MLRRSTMHGFLIKTYASAEVYILFIHNYVSLTRISCLRISICQNFLFIHASIFCSYTSVKHIFSCLHVGYCVIFIYK